MIFSETNFRQGIIYKAEHYRTATGASESVFAETKLTIQKITNAHRISLSQRNLILNFVDAIRSTVFKILMK